MDELVAAHTQTGCLEDIAHVALLPTAVMTERTGPGNALAELFLATVHAGRYWHSLDREKNSIPMWSKLTYAIEGLKMSNHSFALVEQNCGYSFFEWVEFICSLWG